VRADRVPHPQYYEVQKVNQYLNFELVSSSNIHVINSYHFTSADEFDYFYEFVDDGKVVHASEQPINTNEILEIPAFDDTKGEVYLNVYARLRRSTVWADAGFTVAKEQFLLVEKPATKFEAGTGTSSVQESDQNYQVITGKETITIEKETGHLIPWKHEDSELLKEALKPYFW
jgi:beta-galactosidase